MKISLNFIKNIALNATIFSVIECTGRQLHILQFIPFTSKTSFLIKLSAMFVWQWHCKNQNYSTKITIFLITDLPKWRGIAAGNKAYSWFEFTTRAWHL